MRYSKETILKIAYGQLTSSELDQAVVAIAGFSGLFRESWIDDYFGWDQYKRSVQEFAKDPAWLEANFKVGSFPILNIISYWEEWGLLQDNVGAGKILRRWRRNVRAEGVLSEIFIAAQIVRAGAEVELEPPLDSGRKADCRFRFGDIDEWIYVEVSMRGESTKPKADIRAETIREKAAKIAANVVPGLLGTVVILREPNNKEVETILSWLSAINTTGEKRLHELAVFYTGSPGEALPGDIGRVSQLMNGAMPQTSHIEWGKLGIAWLNIRDNMHSKITEDEGKQLPENEEGVVVINATKVVGFKWLPELALDVFRKPESARISCLVFYRLLYFSDGRKVEGHVLVNPHAKFSPSPRTIKVFQEMFPYSQVP
jgi:hypothetical protein